MSAKEIITLQFGNYSNYVGTHWWNMQEFSFNYTNGAASETDPNVLYRQGETRNGDVTYTPRMLLTDLKYGLGALSQYGELYEPPVGTLSEVNPHWPQGKVEVVAEDKISKSEFVSDLDSSTSLNSKKYDLDSTIRTWSDYLYARFHPRSVNVIKEYKLGDKDRTFDAFPLGLTTWATEQFQDDFCDGIRLYAEESDRLQGFHTLIDATDGFSGLSVSCLEYLRDEFDKKSILAFPLIPPFPYNDVDPNDSSVHKQASLRVANLTLCFERLADHSSLYVPLGLEQGGWRAANSTTKFHHVNYNEKSSYHTSAILASAIDTFTLKYRLKQSCDSLSDLCCGLNRNGRKVACGSLCLPFCMNKGAYLIDCLDNWEGPLFKSITPNCNIDSDKVVQTITLRGVNENRLKRPPEQAGKQKTLPAYQCSSVNEMLSLYMSCTSFMSLTDVTTVAGALNVGTPFPDIFDRTVTTDGDVDVSPRSEGSCVSSIPVLAGLHSGKTIGNMLGSLHAEAQRIKFPNFHQFLQAGLECDELTECLDKLCDLRECYEEKYEV